MPCEKWSLKYIRVCENVINIFPSYIIYDGFTRVLMFMARPSWSVHYPQRADYFWTQSGWNEQNRSGVNPPFPPRIGWIVLFKVQSMFLCTEFIREIKLCWGHVWAVSSRKVGTSPHSGYTVNPPTEAQVFVWLNTQVSIMGQTFIWFWTIYVKKRSKILLNCSVVTV